MSEIMKIIDVREAQKLNQKERKKKDRKEQERTEAIVKG